MNNSSGQADEKLYGIVNLFRTDFETTPGGEGRLPYFKSWIDASAELGAQVVRLPGGWRNLEGSGDDRWSQWYVDETVELIRYAGEKGVSVIFGLAQTPDWARPADGSGTWSYPQDVEQYAEAAAYLHEQFAAAGVDRYVAAWEVWNEPNVTRFWPEGDYRYPGKVLGGADIAVDEQAALQYIALLNAAHDALKAVDPDVTVLGGALAGTDFEYVEWMLKHSARFDGLSLHPYTRNYNYNDPTPSPLDVDATAYPEGHGASETLNERWSFKYGIERIHDLLVEDGRSGDMWITEAGWRLAEDDTPWLYMADEEMQAEYLQKALELVESWDFMKAFTVFQLHDAPDGDFGLVNPDGSWRPSGQVFHDFVASLSKKPNLIQSEGYITGTDAADVMRGGNGTDVLVGLAGDDVLHGAGGDDLLIGGAGSEVFMYRASEGHDYARDFDVAEDAMAIEYDGYTSFSDIQPLLRQWGPNTVIDFGEDDRLFLEFVEVNDLTPDNFLFA